MAHTDYLLQGTHRLVKSKFHHLSRLISITNKFSYWKSGHSVRRLLPQSTNTYMISHFEMQVIKLTTKPVYSLHTILYIHAAPNRTDAPFCFLLWSVILQRLQLGCKWLAVKKHTHRKLQ
jgi:hypothetical protein